MTISPHLPALQQKVANKEEQLREYLPKQKPSDQPTVVNGDTSHTTRQILENLSDSMRKAQEKKNPQENRPYRLWTSNCPEPLRFDINVTTIHKRILFESLPEKSQVEIMQKILLDMRREAEPLLQPPFSERLSQEASEKLTAALAPCNKDVQSLDAYKETAQNLQHALDNAYSDLRWPKDLPVCFAAAMVAYRALRQLSIIIQAAEAIGQQAGAHNNHKLLEAIEGANKAMIESRYCFPSQQASCVLPNRCEPNLLII